MNTCEKFAFIVLYSVLICCILSSCANHKLDNYDLGLTAGTTEFSGDSDTKRANTVNARVNFHFAVKCYNCHS